MKPVVYIILVLIIALLLGAVTLSIQKDTVDSDKPPEPVQYTITEVIDWRYTPPDSFEVLYNIHLSNGLIVQKWEEVSEEEYEKYKEIKHER